MIVNGDVSYAGWKAAIRAISWLASYEPLFACRALAVAEDEGRARTGHLRHLSEGAYITRLGALRAATSEEIVQLLFGGASGGHTAAAVAAAAAAAAGCGASRLERGEATTREKKRKQCQLVSLIYFSSEWLKLRRHANITISRNAYFLTRNPRLYGKQPVLALKISQNVSLFSFIPGKRRRFGGGAKNIIPGWSMYYNIKHKHTVRSFLWAVIFSSFHSTLYQAPG